MKPTEVIGGLPVIELEAPGPEGGGARLTRAVIAPGRAMMLLQLWAELPGLGEVDLIECPDLPEAAARLNSRKGPFPGNTAFSFGGAVLAPFANRVRGDLKGDHITAEVGEGRALLAANGALTPDPFAIHGLILDIPANTITVRSDQADGRVRLGQNGAWPSIFDVHIGWRLTSTSLLLTVRAQNIGPASSPIGLGWHPYFRMPSGDRADARIHVPAKTRTLVNNYTAVLPTGAVEPVAGTDYDFSEPDGAALGELYLDDCFIDLIRDGADEAVAEIHDPASGLHLKIASATPAISAFQVYAPPDKAFVVIEPQFNLADPFNPAWDGRPTGMVILEPGADIAYDARIEIV